MSVTELTQRIIEAAKHRTPEQEQELLRKAHILDRDGYYCARFFSKETVQRSKEVVQRRLANS